MAEYIEREKLAEALKIWQNTLIEAYGEDDEYVRCLNSVLLGVDNAPAADVRENKRGKWISVFDDETIIPIKDGAPQGCCYCSVCGDLLVASDEYEVKGNFCPNCGADMREGDA